MRRLFIAPVFVAMVAAGLPQSAMAASSLDQQQPTYDGFSANSTQCVAQTFTAGISGRLDRVSLYVRRLTDHPVMLVQIRNTDGAGGPGQTVLASDTVAGGDIATSFGWVDFEFASPAIVLAGNKYAIVAPPLGPMDASPPPWGFEMGGASQTAEVDPYVGGGFFSGNACEGPFGAQSTDLAFMTYVDIDGVFQPDGRIRVDHGPWTGGNIYNETAAGQWRMGVADPRNLVVFRIGIQNDGVVRDRFMVDSNCAGDVGYRQRYFRGTLEITSAVEAGTYRTTWLAPGGRVTLEAWVRVKRNAAKGSALDCAVEITSVSNPSLVDVVALRAARR